MSDNGSEAGDHATKTFKTKTPLQALVTSLEWDALMVTIIILNCVWIATDNPRLVSFEKYFLEIILNCFLCLQNHL